MVIVYPHNQRFLLRRAHDVLVMKTCHALACAGHQVYLLMGKTSGDADGIVRYYGLEPNPNLHLVQLPIVRGAGRLRFSWHGVFNYFCLKELRRLHRDVGVDVVYLTEMKLGRFLLSRNRKLEVPFVYEVHGLFAPEYARPDAVEEKVFRSVDALVTTTASLQSVIENIYSSLPPMFRVSLASDYPSTTPPFVPPQKGESWRACYIGQLYPLQGVDLLIRALTQLADNLVVDIIGGKPEQIHDLKQLAAREGVSQRVTFHGFVPPSEVAVKASGAHLFVVPCRAEKKMPFVAHTKLYEYLALGRPVVAADLPSVREEIDDGLTGVLFHPGDPEALAAAMRRIVQDPPRAIEIARKGFEKASDYTWEARADGLVACFEKTCGIR